MSKSNSKASSSKDLIGKSGRAKQKVGVPDEYADKLRILCLHGYRQNGESFKSKLGSFRKSVKKYADLVFITAPHTAPALDGEDNGSVVEAENGGFNDSSKNDDQQRGWWFNKDDHTFKGTNQNGPAFGFDESLRLVEKAWQEQGPFQGVLGFSQGACFAALLCSLSHKSMTKIKPKFAILSSGFKSGSLAHLNYYEQIIPIPSLHIYGETDQIIPRDMSEYLESRFEDPQRLLHAGGHFFPASTKERSVYVNYFQDRLQEYLEEKELAEAAVSGKQFFLTEDNEQNGTTVDDDDDSD